MPQININEIDNTIYGVSSVYNNNIAFIPGNAITGPSDNPVLLNSLEEFLSTFGPNAPESNSSVGTSWDYAYGLLYAGIPVLFKRITQKVSGDTVEELTVKASATISNEGQPVIIIKAIYGGSYGNLLNYSIEHTGTAYYLRIYRATKLIENVRLANVLPGDTQDVINKKVFDTLNNTTFNNVEITVNEANSGFTIPLNSHVYLKGGKDASEDKVIEQLPNEYNMLYDKYVYDVKFITSGGYFDADKTSTPITDAIVNIAEKRADCIALPNIPIGLPHNEVTTFYVRNTSYASIFAPWIYTRLPNKSEKWMPPSYIFLYALAKSISRGSPIWNPPAGVTRASITEAVKAEYEIGGSIMQDWQNSNAPINPIMQLRQYGYVIYGQKTLYSIVEDSLNNKSVLQELGVRITINEIKKAAFNTALLLTFENNNIHTWNEFRGRMDPILAQMKADRGINDYQIIMDETIISSEDISANKIHGKIRVSVSQAVEDFDIDFDLEPSSVTFSDEGEETITL